MFYAATLISHPERPALTHALAREAARFLPFGRLGRWLDPEIAIEIDFQLEDLDSGPEGPAGERPFLADLAVKVREIMDGAPIDVVIQRDEHRRKKLLVADMDSTMIGQECIDELADYIGLKEHVAAITERAMRGEIEFVPALRERVALLRGLSASVVEEVIRERIRLTPGARTLIATMRANRAYTCLVSGGFTAFTSRIAKLIGFNAERANTLLVDAAGRLAGSVAEPVLGREAKRETLIELTRSRRLRPQQTLAVGDGANDIPMIEAAGLGVAFHGKPAVAAAADARIDHGDLTALLYAQGYRRNEFVEG